MSQDSATGPIMTDAASPPPPRSLSGARVAALIAGSLVGLIAVGLLIAGVALLWGNTKKDADGYVSTGTHGLHTSTYAITTDNLGIDHLDAAGFVWSDRRLGEIRVQASSRSGKPVFVGIAPTRDVSRYLANTAHSVVADIDYGLFESFDVAYRAQDGSGRPAAPARQDFWAAAVDGTGAQALTWKVRDGNWSIVVMNADGSAGIDTGIRAAADVPFLGTAGRISLGASLVLLAAAAGLFYLGARPLSPGRPDRSDSPNAIVAAA